MCTSNSKFPHRKPNDAATPATTTTLSDINGRRVLQPATSNRNSPFSEPPRPLKKTPSLPKSITPVPSPATNSKPNQLPISPQLKSPPAKSVKKSKNCNDDHCLRNSTPGSGSNSPATVVGSPGSIAAARREQVAVMQVQRKMRIAHYGRSKSYGFDRNSGTPPAINVAEPKRCSFITSSSDAIYVAYHDDEWGVPVHDDKMLFELLVLTGAQVGSDWTSVLKKRHQFWEAFSGFDANIVYNFTEKRITLISREYGIEVNLVRGVVDNAKSIIEVNKTFGSFNNYIWGFVNHKPIVSQYKSSHKMPVKTSKAEAISKDMVRRRFRQVGPTIIHSFMQAAGLTNDHLITCPRHQQCVALASLTTPILLTSVN